MERALAQVLIDLEAAAGDLAAAGGLWRDALRAGDETEGGIAQAVLLPAAEAVHRLVQSKYRLILQRERAERSC